MSVMICVQIESLYFEMPDNSTEDQIEKEGMKRFKKAVKNKEIDVHHIDDINKIY